MQLEEKSTVVIVDHSSNRALPARRMPVETTRLRALPASTAASRKPAPHKGPQPITAASGSASRKISNLLNIIRICIFYVAPTTRRITSVLDGSSLTLSPAYSFNTEYGFVLTKPRYA
jgi:hypothetical protein